MYIKAFTAQGELTGAEKLDPPVWVRWQLSNGLLVRCEQEEAQGVVSEDGERIYLIGGQQPHGIPEAYAEEITEAEYDAIHGEDPEDEDPDIPEGDDTPPMTRAELTAKVAELEEQNAMLTECLLEMSEIVYGE